MIRGVCVRRASCVVRVRVQVCKLACSCACVHVCAQAVHAAHAGRRGGKGRGEHLKVDALKVEAVEAVEVEAGLR